MRSRGLLLSLVLGPALATPAASCGGADRCDPDAPGTICTIAGTGEQGFAGDGGAATTAAFYAPQDTAISPDGELWILDFNNFRIRAVDARGRIRTVIGNGLIADDPPEGVRSMPALEAGLNHVGDLLFHGDYLYLAAWHNSRVKRVRLSDMTLENHAGRGRRTYYDGDGGPALAASLDLPASLAIDPAGDLVILDQGNQVIRRIDAAGRIQRIAGKCVTYTEDGCGPTEQPVACAGSAEHPGSNKFACGVLDTACDYPCFPGFGGDGGPALEARMAQPFGAAAWPGGGIAYDAAGNLYVADVDNDRIRKIDPAGVITTIAGTGVAGAAGDGGPATEAQLHGPSDLAIGPDGTIYVADTYNNCIRKIDPSGIISTVAGKCSAEPTDRGFDGDGGSPLEAKLDRPTGIDLAGEKLYVTDTFNNRIRVVSLP